MNSTDSAAYRQGATRHARRCNFGTVIIVLTIFLWHASLIHGFARSYTVKSGDTLERIAKRELGSSTRWQEIAQVNHLPPPYKIHLNQQLTLPEQQATPPVPAIPANPFPSPGLTPPLVPAPPISSGTMTPPVPIVHSDTPATSFPVEPSKKSLLDKLPFSWWVIPLGLIAALLLHALVLHISCWFSLVEVTYLRCLKLSVYLLLFALLSFGIIAALAALSAWVGLSGKFEPWAAKSIFVILPVAFVCWFTLSLIIMKRTLDCKWRSVVTILIMSNYATMLVGFIVLACSTSFLPVVQALTANFAKI